VDREPEGRHVAGLALELGGEFLFHDPVLLDDQAINLGRL
jgi:hypothetical protein